MATTYGANKSKSGQNQNTHQITESILTIDVGSTASTTLYEGRWDEARRMNIQVRNDSDSDLTIGYYHTSKPVPEATADATDWYLEPDGSTTYTVSAGTSHRQSIDGPREKWKVMTSGGALGSASTGSVSIYASKIW